MATNGDDLITELSRRLRDPNNDRHARTLVLDVLTQCQRVLNYQQENRLTTISFTPAAGRTLYQTSAVAADVAKIVEVSQEGRKLYLVDWHDLPHTDTHWLRRTSNQYEMFARVGGNMFALIPALDRVQAVDVTYVTVPAAVVDGATAIDVDDKLVPALLDLGELILLAKNRDFCGLPELEKRIAKELRVNDPLGQH
jgi:hypothetical protein